MTPAPTLRAVADAGMVVDAALCRIGSEESPIECQGVPPPIPRDSRKD